MRAHWIRRDQTMARLLHAAAEIQNCLPPVLQIFSCPHWFIVQDAWASADAFNVASKGPHPPLQNMLCAAPDTRKSIKMGWVTHGSGWGSNHAHRTGETRALPDADWSQLLFATLLAVWIGTQATSALLDQGFSILTDIYSWHWEPWVWGLSKLTFVDRTSYKYDGILIQGRSMKWCWERWFNPWGCIRIICFCM